METHSDKSFVIQVWGNVRNMVVGASAAVMFGLVVLGLSIMAAVNPLAVSPHQDATSGGVLVQKVEYYLPYPGLLPDSPLYKVKALRDRVSLWLITDLGKKAEKELLLADKRIGAAAALLDGGKDELAVSTATKGEKYLEQAVNRVLGMAERGQDVKSLLGILANATTKHEEMMVGIVGKTEQARGVAEKTLALTSMLHERIDQAVREIK
ncbi:hypothetical protein HYS82_03195 [Candidatus Amesbacteria bacterium]|nr:hypothetical protein [Candidatus Amesbacteria bacterium]MBI2587268.1 hypothetical protein [Candidatus Amesbacteria bacterium]